ncbi:Prolyl 4-hydroxylase alpha subunit [Arabidopsis thaliana x Arabidopsis arenosa]|uniref:Prolyl 4-hydroxylase alpha subunit n=1 Tax=Arabidopsis thaliana x Arabidopsis arenosa TaxID=1240361 RepID=A0A8T1XF65_9BRAS|nr:Prolyl 4-hydroxylase alpha subunit [Arabidopsis thaliana x Arabidopsis arenosa]
MTVDGDGTVGGGDHQPPVTTAAATTEMPIPRLSLLPNNEHISDNYEDLELEFTSAILRSIEKYLPMDKLTANREEKAKFMSDILCKYISRGECSKAKRYKNYRERIISNYQPRFRELYKLDPESFLLPTFRKAISENTEESFRRIISEPFPGVFVFEMFQPDFFEKLLAEVENFRTWAHETKLKITRPNKMSKFGVVLDDFGLDIMLTQLMEDFIFPICKVFFPKVCGAMFDSPRGFFIENGEDRDAELGFHVEDSEITLNVCLSKQGEGGEIFFAGTRCKKHMDIDPKPEERFDYCHILGQAILHRGCHVHGARAATTSGRRANMILWCRNSLFREMQTYEKEFRDWCGQCVHEKKEKESQSLAAKRKVKKKKRHEFAKVYIRCLV